MNEVTSKRNGLEIAVIGMAGRFPKAKNVNEFWQNLLNGVECITFFTDEQLNDFGIDQATIANPQYVKARPVLEDAEWFDASFFGASPREAELMDPQQRVFLECAWEALENAGYDSEQYKGLIGVYAGTGLSTYLINNLSSHPHIIGSGGLFQTTILNDKDYLSTRVSYKLNLQGPSMVIQTACSTSLVAVHEACQALLSGECDIALAGGVRITIPQNAGYWYQEGGILSPDGHCRAFDEKAHGTVGGNGAGIVVLKRLDDAVNEGDFIHAVIKGSAINNDGSLKVGFTAPRVDGQAKAISSALQMADVEPQTITYIEAHGTGTPLGDPIEIAALKKVFQDCTERGYCGVGSVKTNVGHLDAAAGVTGLIKTVLSLQHSVLPPSLHFQTPNPQLDLASSPFYVNATRKEWAAASPRRAGVSSFGVGGTNAHVIVEEAVQTEDSSESRSLQLLIVSAKTSTALDAATANLAEHLEKNPELKLGDVAYTLQVGRRSFSHRRILIADSVDDATRALRTLDPKGVFTGTHKEQDPPVAFMFPGQGAQYPNMGRALYEQEGKFREQVDLCCEILRPHLNLDLRELLYPSEKNAEGAQQLAQTKFTQPALFVIGYSLAKLWMAWGVRPEAMIGHSIGEYVAACLAGVFSLENALTIVADRGRLMQELPAGVMLAVRLSKEELQPLLGEDLALAAHNGPSLCVVAGEDETVKRLENVLAGRSVGCRRLVTSHAFHSAMMEPILGRFVDVLKKVSLKAPQIPYVSNLTGTWITAAQTTDPNYWAQHVRQTVKFSEGVRELLREPARVLLEVGPGQTLTTLAKQHTAQAAEQRVLSSSGEAKNADHDMRLLLEAVGRLWIAGARVDWAGFYEQEKRHRVPLPTYPFERQRYWIEPRDREVRQHEPLRKKTNVADWFYTPSWKRSVPPELLISQNSGTKKSNWLVFVDDFGLGHDIVKRLASEGHVVSSVYAGDRFEKGGDREYKLNPGRREDYDSLMNDLSSLNRTPNKIVHLWNVSPVDRRPLETERFDDAQESGFYSLLFLAQALGKLTGKGAIRIDVVTSNMYEVTGEETLSPEKTTILGPCKVIPRELAGTVCRTIDVIHDSKIVPDKLVDQLVAEFLSRLSDSTVAYRGRVRWVQTFEPIQWEGPVDATTQLRERGVYLITGGLGGVGLQLAEHLARTVQAKLVLTGRSSLPRRDEWDSHVTNDLIGIEFSHVDRLKEEIERELSIQRLYAYPGLEDALNKLCSSYIYDYFRAGGITLDQGPTFGTDELKSKLEVLPKFEKFYQLMIRVLEEDGIVRLSDGNVHVLKSSVDVEDPEALHRELETKYPQFSGLLNLLRHCARNYPEALSGKIEAIGVLYPDGSSHLLDDSAKNTIEYRNGRLYQLLLRELIDRLASSSSERKLRILEVGGGRGSLTRLIAPILKSTSVEYHFTDIGKTFVVQAEAEAKKSGFDFMKFGQLDISKNPLVQGFDASSFDIIFGLDVVHATPSIVRTIRNLKSLLSPNGLLMLVEGVKTERWIDMIWGLAEGWWYFTDSELRKTSPLLRLDRWEDVFKREGFEAVQAYPRAESERSETDAGLIVGRKPATAGVSDNGHCSSISDPIRKVKELEELGAEVLVATADVSNFDQMQSLINDTKKRFGDINGIIHAAGIEGGGLIQSMTREKAEQEFAAKVRGTLVLNALFENEELDFFVLCSARSALTGSLGQVGYCAANAFMDGFAHFKASQGSERTISVNWGRWQSVGMAVTVEERHKELTGEDIEEQMTASEGVQAFSHLLSSKCVPQLIVSTQDFQAPLAQTDDRPQSVVEKPEPAPQTSPAHDRPALEDTYIAPDNDVEQAIATIWQEVLGIDRVGSRDNFMDLGGDSLIAIQVLSRVRKRFAVDLAVTSLFDAPTVSELAVMVVQKQLAQVDSEQLAQVLAEIKQLSKDEITQMLTSEGNAVGEKEL